MCIQVNTVHKHDKLLFIEMLNAIFQTVYSTLNNVVKNQTTCAIFNQNNNVKS